MTKVMCSPPHAIVFVLDPTDSAVVIPEYIEGQPVASTESCVSIVTQTPEDGEVTLEMIQGGSPPSGMHSAFHGGVFSSSGRVAVVQTGMEMLTELEVEPGLIPLSVWLDDLSFPAHVFINIGSINYEYGSAA